MTRPVKPKARAALLAALLATPALAAQPLPDAGDPEALAAPAVLQRLSAEFLTDDERRDLRLRHGLWQPADLADPAANAASWQWVAGSGADAAPYFRIFNPVLQGEKFDTRGDYVRRWLPDCPVCARQEDLGASCPLSASQHLVR